MKKIAVIYDQPPGVFVYRLYNARRRLLYVGVTSNWQLRQASHRNTKPWWGDVVKARLTHTPSRKDALLLEKKLIRDERPLHNRKAGFDPREWAKRPVPKSAPAGTRVRRADQDDEESIRHGTASVIEFRRATRHWGPHFLVRVDSSGLSKCWSKKMIYLATGKTQPPS